MWTRIPNGNNKLEATCDGRGSNLNKIEALKLDQSLSVKRKVK